MMKICAFVSKRRQRIAVLLTIIFIFAIFTLFSCGESCEHSFGEGVALSVAECGSGGFSQYEYTCEICNFVKREEVKAMSRHNMDTHVEPFVDCFTPSVMTGTCTVCGFVRQSEVPARGAHLLDLESRKVEGDRVSFRCKNCGKLEYKSLTVNYDDFGAVGDGVADDSAAIRAAHSEANTYGLKVVATAGRSYRIGVLEEPITVMTDTDWCGARIIFDDSEIPWNSELRSVWIFKVVSSDKKNGTRVQVPDGLTLKAGQTNVGMTFSEPCMLKIQNENEKIYLRYGANANNGTGRREVILVDEQGNVDPTTPIQYDYSTVTRITRYSVDDEPIFICNGYIETLVHDPRAADPSYENNYCYYNRGLRVERSNTTLYNIEHRILGEDMTDGLDRNGDGVIDLYGADKSYGVPYIGVFNFEACCGSGMTDCKLQGHQAYSFFQGANRNEPGTTRNEMGSYDLNAANCINLSFINLTQRENPETGELITNRVMYHGLMASNFCRNLLLDGCYVDRFDAHQGLHNATVRNSTIGFGILVIGGGTLLIENVDRLSGSAFISLRADYNSIFDGDVIIRSCTAGKSIKTLVSGTWRSFDNGLPNVMTRSLTVDGLGIAASGLTLYSISGADADSLTDTTNPLLVL